MHAMLRLKATNIHPCLLRVKSQSKSRMSAAQLDEQRRQEIGKRCKKEAWQAGTKASLTTLGLAGATVGGANTFWHGFRTSLGVSGKAALVVSYRATLHTCWDAYAW